MSRSWLLPSRATESLADSLVATGAAGIGVVDPVDGDTGWRPAGGSARDLPRWTLEKERRYSLAAYRSNPMARAIIDTYTSFAVGDKGVTLQCVVPEVAQVAQAFWNDPRNNLGARQELALRSNMLNGESLYEMLVGETTGVVRYSAIDPTAIERITNERGNPLWPGVAWCRSGGHEAIPLSIVQVDELTQLRTGDVHFWPTNQALETDTRGQPFLAPVLDWLDSYDMVLSNLIDRTALARYLVWDVTIDGSDEDVKAFVAQRGGTQAPRSGSVEVHNKAVTWDAKYAQTGATEDTATAGATLTNIAAGTGLARTWLSDPEHANRATSLSMAEPVRRRVSGVQKVWLACQTEFVRFAVDRAVAVGACPRTVLITDEAGQQIEVAAAATVHVLGPEIAAADAEITAGVLAGLAQGLETMVASGVMTPAAATVAAKKAWEDYVGIPYNPELDDATGGRQDDVAAAVDAAGGGNLVAMAGGMT